MSMNEEQRSLLLDSSSRFPPPQGVKLSYGTSGFRADASILGSTMFRVGILAALRALKTHSVIGLMITASHNIVSDNGVKIADPSGWSSMRGHSRSLWRSRTEQIPVVGKILPRIGYGKFVGRRFLVSRRMGVAGKEVFQMR